MENRDTALVRGSSAIFPAGYLWLIPLWYGVIAALVVVKGKPPSWYGPYALGALLLAALILLVVLSTVRNNAFLADDSGIWLGLRGGAGGGSREDDGRTGTCPGPRSSRSGSPPAVTVSASTSFSRKARRAGAAT